MVVRVFGLLVVGLLAAAALTGGLAWWRAQLTGAPIAASSEVWASRVGAYVQALEGAPAAERAPIVTLGELAGIRRGAPDDARQSRDAETRAAALAAALGRDVAVVEGRGPRACGGTPVSPFGPPAWHCYGVSLQLRDGTPLGLRVDASFGTGVERGDTDASQRRVRGGWLLPVVLLLALVALAAVITRVALAPVFALSRAADRFADDVDAAPLPERGPREIRTALAAFNRMQSRIRAHLAERTSMLAAIAHDLQTPLTRLRLRIEQVDDAPLRERLAGDLGDCQARVREGLDLARSLDDRTPLAVVDLDALLQSACDEARDAGMAVTLEGSSGLEVHARPQALLRCVENLLANAVKYGERAELSARREGDHAVIVVRDRGPGIAPADRERVFEPFVRLEGSRSRDTGGTGLGLTIVRNLMRRQAGDVVLGERGDGERGLEARLMVPLA